MYRQGDVLIVTTDQIPKGATEVPRDNGRVVLAYGEITGHAHAFRGPQVCLFRDAEGTYLKVDGPADLKHEEHDTIKVPKGKYRVIRQREWNAGEVRRVAD